MGDYSLTASGDREHWDETRVQLSKATPKASDEGHSLKLTDEQSLLEALAHYHVDASQ
jgi:hypothetical protein